MVHLPVALPKILLSEVNFTNLPCTLVKTAVRTHSLHYKYFLRPLLGWEQEKLCLRGRLKISARIRLRTTSFSLCREINRTLIREQNGFSVTGMNQYAVCWSLASSWFFIVEFTSPLWSSYFFHDCQNHFGGKRGCLVSYPDLSQPSGYTFQLQVHGRIRVQD